MADLMSSLLLPQRSQESFHSTHSYHRESPPASPPASPLPESSSNTHNVAFRAAGIPVCDVEAFLNDPNNQALLSGNAKNSPTSTQQAMSNPFNRSPVQLAKSSHHVAVLNQLCQERGLVPTYEIDGDQLSGGFWGWLKIGNETIGRDEKWPSKKDAKEALAERGVEMVRNMQAKGKEPVNGAQKNWIGMLQGTFTLHPFSPPPFRNPPTILPVIIPTILTSSPHHQTP